MKQLGLISFGSPSKEELATFEERKAARAIVFDADKNIALLFVSKNGYHKLPGGGIEDGETMEEALYRECLEEIGCNVNIKQAVGSIIEHKTKMKIVQESFCWIAKVVGEKGESHLTESEVRDGFKVEWMSIEKAIKTMSGEEPIVYEGKFIQKRDLLFLEEAQRLLS